MSVPCSRACASMRPFKRSVAIEPGLMALTLTPSRLPRSASTLVRFINAALTAPPMAKSALPVRPPMPAMLTIVPCVRMRCGHAARQSRIAANSLSAKPSCQSASIRSRKSPRFVAPATLTTASMRPHCSMVVAISSAGAVGSRRSQATNLAPCANLLVRSRRRSAERATATMRAPSAASLVAMARPMPLLAPVTMQTESERPRSIAAC